jgi:hypothetical protein
MTAEPLPTAENRGNRGADGGLSLNQARNRLNLAVSKRGIRGAPPGQARGSASQLRPAAAPVLWATGAPQPRTVEPKLLLLPRLPLYRRGCWVSGARGGGRVG